MNKRSTRNSNPIYSGARQLEIGKGKEKKIRDLEYMEYEDDFSNIYISKPLQPKMKQPLYNRFKYVIKRAAEEEYHWRDLDEYEKVVKKLINEKWKKEKQTQKLKDKLVKFWRAYNETAVTLRPLQGSSQHCGIFAIQDIQAEVDVEGLEGLISVKACNEDSKAQVEKKLHGHLIKKVLTTAHV